MLFSEVLMGDQIRGDIGDGVEDVALGRDNRVRRESGQRVEQRVILEDRPKSARGYLEDIWGFEQHAATVRNRIVIAQIATAISLVSLVIVLATIGFSFAGYVNQQFYLIDARFGSIEERLRTIDNRIQRIATPEPEFWRQP
jgi:hypothetical protein